MRAADIGDARSLLAKLTETGLVDEIIDLRPPMVFSESWQAVETGHGAKHFDTARGWSLGRPAYRVDVTVALGEGSLSVAGHYARLPRHARPTVELASHRWVLTVSPMSRHAHPAFEDSLDATRREFPAARLRMLPPSGAANVESTLRAGSGYDLIRHICDLSDDEFPDLMPRWPQITDVIPYGFVSIYPSAFTSAHVIDYETEQRIGSGSYDQAVFELRTHLGSAFADPGEDDAGEISVRRLTLRALWAPTFANYLGLSDELHEVTREDTFVGFVEGPGWVLGVELESPGGGRQLRADELSDGELCKRVSETLAELLGGHRVHVRAPHDQPIPFPQMAAEVSVIRVERGSLVSVPSRALAEEFQRPAANGRLVVSAVGLNEAERVLIGMRDDQPELDINEYLRFRDGDSVPATGETALVTGHGTFPVGLDGAGPNSKALALWENLLNTAMWGVDVVVILGPREHGEIPAVEALMDPWHLWVIPREEDDPFEDSEDLYVGDHW